VCRSVEKAENHSADEQSKMLSTVSLRHAICNYDHKTIYAKKCLKILKAQFSRLPKAKPMFAATTVSLKGMVCTHERNVLKVSEYF